MNNLLKMEKYQLSHNIFYWCGLIGIFLIGFLPQILMSRKLWGLWVGLLHPSQIFLMEWFTIQPFS